MKVVSKLERKSTKIVQGNPVRDLLPVNMPDESQKAKKPGKPGPDGKPKGKKKRKKGKKKKNDLKGLIKELIKELKKYND